MAPDAVANVPPPPPPRPDEHLIGVMEKPRATAAGRVTPREAMEMARYGEPIDTYTWDLVVDRCLTHLAARGYKIVETEADDGE